MKYTSSVLALGLAGSATASWNDWSSSADPVKETSTSSSMSWEDWSSSSAPAESTTKSYDPTWSDWSAASSTPAESTKASSTYDPTWSDWSAASSSVPADKSTKSTEKGNWGASTSSVPAYESSKPADGGKWGASTAGNTVTVTETVYKSTVYVGPGECTKTIFPSTCAGGAPASSYPADASKPAANTWGAASSAPADASKPAANTWGAAASSYPADTTKPAGNTWAAPASSAPADASKGWVSWASSAPAAESSSAGSAGWGGAASSGWGAASSAPADGSAAYPTGGWAKPDGPLDAGKSASVVATNEAVYTWTGEVGSKPTASAAPTYAGWGDWSGNGTEGSGSNGTGPDAGSSASNVTKPFPHLEEAGCNSPSSRNKWCGKYSIDTDYYAEYPSTGKTCSAYWVITNTTLNYDGLDRLALAINGQVPGPLLECNWGDQIEVTITNKMTDNSTTIHWHGITQIGTNDQDGVPGVTECAVAPGQTRTYSFKANQYGTGWYHSHVLTQYGDGIRGPMVIHGPATANYDIDAGTVMIDDLFGTPAKAMSVAETNSRIAHFGPGGTWNYMLNGANTFPDLSKGKHALWKVKSGQKYLFRMINSASQNMWSVHFDNHKMTVISTDYVPITPYQTEWLNIGIGQRYDVIVEMNQPTAGYFLRAVAQTGCPSGCANSGLGSANGIFVYDGADMTLPTSTAGNKTAADFAICADEPLAKLSPYLKKSGGSQQSFTQSVSTLPAGAVATVNTTDDGTVFKWFLNNGVMNVNYTQPTLQTLAGGKASNTSVSNYISLNSKNQWVYFVIQNQFFASHPMHLHGHDMSVLGQGTTAWNPSLVSTLNFDNPARRTSFPLLHPRASANQLIVIPPCWLAPRAPVHHQGTLSLVSRPTTQVLG